MQRGLIAAPPDGVFGWLAPTLQTSDDDFFRLSGLDALMYTKFFLVGIKVFVVGIVVGLLFLLPVNETSSNPVVNLTDIPALSLSALPDDSPRLWSPFVCMHVMTLATIFFITRAFKTYAVSPHHKIKWINTIRKL